MNELRERYRESSRPRLAEMREALDALPSDDALRLLARHFHAFSGMGATYGFRRVSELGDEGEGLFDAQLENAIPRWRELVDEIERELC
ncbi:MAG TPA: Hpt domain-containing protein [Thermoanaerobaculia bacterium]|jgi:HPt (histidine-containing phosphotransfer) domain-containing protein